MMQIQIQEKFKMSKTIIVKRGLDLSSSLFLIFLVLKLTKVIDWSWWYVTMPIWLGWAVLFGVAAVIGLGFLITELLDKFLQK